jgi:hypothetical protein
MQDAHIRVIVLGNNRNSTDLDEELLLDDEDELEEEELSLYLCVRKQPIEMHIPVCPCLTFLYTSHTILHATA